MDTESDHRSTPGDTAGREIDRHQILADQDRPGITGADFGRADGQPVPSGAIFVPFLPIPGRPLTDHSQAPAA